jgi:hypothetical protein
MTRSEVISVRLDPKLRFGAELAARTQRRTLSSLIEWAVEFALKTIKMRDPRFFNDPDITLSEALDLVWDVDETDRFLKLAMYYPELLTFEEQVLWKLIRENGYVWRGHYNASNTWTWEINLPSLIHDRVRENWDKFRGVASGQLPSSVLPAWQKTSKSEKPAESKESGEYLEDDIPF